MADVIKAPETGEERRRSTAPLKVDASVDQLISDGAHFLHMTKKDLVAAAVRMYLEVRREEMRQSMREKMRRLDGSDEAAVALLTGIPRERIRELGGVDEDGPAESDAGD